jgi:ABC-type transporter Mla maintaining outer membrane lipid asymmetry ATPase subunit MlaF
MRDYLRLSDRLLREVALTKLEMVGLDAEDGDKFPSELSGGMTKRVALARALALDPEIVFLDEPTSSLDPTAAGDFDDLIGTLQQTLGLTVFMVTHDLESLHTVCDRVAALADGKVIAIGPMQTMLESEHPWMSAYFRGKRAHGLRVRPSILRCAREPYNSAQHEPDHCENDESDMAAGKVLIVFRKSAAAAKPAVSTLNDPALGQYKKTLDHI